MEIWKEIPGFKDYEVSTLGRIKSYKLNKESILCLKKHPRGYLFVHLCGPQGRKKVVIHQCVMEVFGPERPPNTTVDHINRIRSDNRIENLRWATEKEQRQNSIPARQLGEKNPDSRLTSDQVLEIKKRLGRNESSRKIALDYNVSKTSILNIKNKKLWTHIEIS